MAAPEIVVSPPEGDETTGVTETASRLSRASRKSEKMQSKQYLEVPQSSHTRPIKTEQDVIEAACEDNCEDEPDETFSERVWGLTEMFPDPVRNFFGTVASCTVSGVKNFYQFSCNASWIFFTSSMILFAPVIFETERAQMEEMQRTQQKQVLLGPGSAISTSGGSPALPPMTR